MQPSNKKFDRYKFHERSVIFLEEEIEHLKSLANTDHRKTAIAPKLCAKLEDLIACLTQFTYLKESSEKRAEIKAKIAEVEKELADIRQNWGSWSDLPRCTGFRLVP